MSQTKEAIEKGLEVLSWCQENADEKWMVDHLALVRTHIDQALAKLKAEQPPAGEFTKKVRETWPKKTFAMAQDEVDLQYEQLKEACDIIDRSTARLKAMYVGDLSPESRLSG